MNGKLLSGLLLILFIGNAFAKGELNDLSGFFSARSNISLSIYKFCIAGIGTADVKRFVSCSSVGEPNGCRPHCIMNGHKSGSCVNGNCQCSGFFTEKIATADVEQFVTCNSLNCRLHCILHGHKSGSCVNGNSCRCS